MNKNLNTLVLIVLFWSCQTQEKMKGVSWVGSPYIVQNKDFKPVKDIGVNWIVQTPFGWQNGVNDTSIILSTGKKYYWGESDIGLIETNTLGLQNSIKTLLKPHIWIRRANGKWRSDIEMNSEKNWDAWFASYETFIMHYAKLAEKHNFDALAIGTELHQTVVQKPDKWRNLIKKIRSVYHGKLTYAANWYKEFEDITFWDDLDFIGVQGYFPLTTKKSPNIEDLNKGWTSHKKTLRDISRKYDKQIIFTEIGYKSTSDAAIEPWVWPSRKDRETKTINLETQRLAYQSFFQTFWDEDWVKGVFFWKWFPNHEKVKGKLQYGFTPQHKPAENEIKTWFMR